MLAVRNFKLDQSFSRDFLTFKNLSAPEMPTRGSGIHQKGVQIGGQKMNFFCKGVLEMGRRKPYELYCRARNYFSKFSVFCDSKNAFFWCPILVQKKNPSLVGISGADKFLKVKKSKIFFAKLIFQKHVRQNKHTTHQNDCACVVELKAPLSISQNMSPFESLRPQF